MDSNRQARAETTRLQVLAAAREVFRERGYGGATVAAITQRAEIAHGTFYLYFKNKEAVFLVLISDVLEELYQHSFTPIEAFSGPYDPVRTRKRIAAYYAVFSRHGRLWRAVLEGALASPTVEEHWMTERRRFTQALATRWEMLQSDGAIRPFDTHATAVALASMLEWFALTTLAFGPQLEPFVVGGGTEALQDERAIDALVDIWTRAIGPPS